MGQKVQQDWALPVMHGLMQILDTEWAGTKEEKVREHVASLGACALIAFCGSFHGAEIFLTDLHSL
jgi:hypothetical protein